MKAKPDEYTWEITRDLAMDMLINKDDCTVSDILAHINGIQSALHVEQKRMRLFVSRMEEE